MAEEEKIEQHIIADRTLIRTARIISGILTPFSIPFLAFLVLFLFSYLRIMPLQYKLIVLGIVYCFTILMPTMTIFLFRKVNGFARQDLSDRKKRYVPILLTIISYVFCLMMMHKLNIPWYMTGIILASLVVLVICIIVNLKWKLSEHMAGMGGIVGGLVSFSALFSYNPVWGYASSSSWRGYWVRHASSCNITPSAKYLPALPSVSSAHCWCSIRSAMFCSVYFYFKHSINPKN